MFWINSSPDSRKLGSIINTTANRIPRTSTLLAVRHTGRVSFAGTFRHTLFQQQCTDDIANDRLARPFAFLRYGIPVSVTGSVLWFFFHVFPFCQYGNPFQNLDLGANDYITKPFGTEELLARIRAVLRSHWHSEENGRDTRRKTLLFDCDDILQDIVEGRGGGIRILPVAGA